MATVVPPLSKRQKRLAQEPAKELEAPTDIPHVRVRFQAFDTGDVLPGNILIPGTTTVKQLELLLNELKQSSDDPVPYEFTLQSDTQNVDITSDLYTDVIKPDLKSAEEQFTLVYTPRAVFKVKPITRTSGTGMGHGATILTAQFAPHTSSRVVTGAGDSTARIWNSDTQTPIKTLSGHSDWVLAASWSPDGSMIATGSMDATVRVWDAKTGEPLGKPFVGHSKFITSLAWEPLHLVKDGRPRLASSSKDGTVRVWSPNTWTGEFILSGHKSSVSYVKWGGFGDIYSTSHDKTVKVWSGKDGRLVSTLQAHAHWVNHLALSTDYALRTGPFDEKTRQRGGTTDLSAAEMRKLAQEKFQKLTSMSGVQRERVVTASDDFTMFLWEPAKSTKPLARLTGHQKLVNHVSFSPDGRYIASASFDNSVKLWDGRDGKFISSLRGHVAAVYQCAWSADSRLLASASKDTTLKVWDIKTRKLKSDLPGHSDEVYAVDWSVDGEKVCSGSKDKTVRFWSH